MKRSRRRIPAAVEFPPRHVRPEADVFSIVLRPPRWVPKLHARIQLSELGAPPAVGLVQAAMPARRTFLPRRVMQRFYDTGPAQDGFAFGHPPLGNAPSQFKQKPPRRLRGLLPQGGALWSPPTYGE